MFSFFNSDDIFFKFSFMSLYAIITIIIAIVKMIEYEKNFSGFKINPIDNEIIVPTPIVKIKLRRHSCLLYAKSNLFFSIEFIFCKQ